MIKGFIIEAFYFYHSNKMYRKLQQIQKYYITTLIQDSHFQNQSQNKLYLNQFQRKQ